MLCENCNKKDATSIFMPPNENKLKYLCGACYRKLNLDNSLDNFAYAEVKNIKLDSKCKSCGLEFKEFEKTGLFACENCYASFADFVKQNIISKFKEQKYLGKKPNVFYIRQEIKNLENLIELNLKNGNFQKATIYGKELEKLKAENYDKLQ